MIDTLKKVIKYFLFAIIAILILPIGILILIEKHISKKELIYLSAAQAFALLPGRPGDLARSVYYMMTLEKFHPSAFIAFGSYFSDRRARVAENAGFGTYCIIGLVDIEANVRVASKVSIVSGLQEHGSSAHIGEKREKELGMQKLIKIGANVWIGEGAMVGANVGEGSIVGMGSVVINDIPENSFAMGNPARLLPSPQK